MVSYNLSDAQNVTSYHINQSLSLTPIELLSITLSLLIRPISQLPLLASYYGHRMRNGSI